MRRRSDLTTEGMIAVGASAGGLASVGLAARPPQGLIAVISFGGGRGENDVCDDDRLVAAFGTLGKAARVPILWVYSENDLFVGPELAQLFHAAFQASGGRATFIAAPAFGPDGHSLFSRRRGHLDADNRRLQNLGLRTLLPPPSADALAPAHFGGPGRAAFKEYLLAGDHKAFAIGPRRYGFRTGLRTKLEARAAALEACAKGGATCSIYAVDDELESERAARAR